MRRFETTSSNWLPTSTNIRSRTCLPLGRYSGWNVISISPRPRLVWPWHSCHLYSRTSHDGRPHGPMVCRLRHHVHPVDGSCVNFHQDVCAGRVPNKTSKSSHSVSRRWHQRRACPNRRRQVAGEVGPAGHHREPHRRRRQHRCCRGGAGGPRWLYPAGLGNAAARHQPKPLQGVVLQAGRIRADHELRISAQSRDRAQRAAGDSLSELIAYARANPGKLVYGSQGVGNTPHLTANMFMTMTGTSMVHVPYRGETLVYNDMLGERVDVFFGNISGAFALYQDGKLKVLAVTDKARAAAMPDVPTSAEVGLPDLLSGVW